jgi:hypothetical protein
MRETERLRAQHPKHGNHEAQGGQWPHYQLECFPYPHCTPLLPLYLVPVTEHVSEPPALHIIADSFFLSMVFGGPFCPENNRHGFYKNTLLLKLLHVPSVLRRGACPSGSGFAYGFQKERLITSLF